MTFDAMRAIVDRPDAAATPEWRNFPDVFPALRPPLRPCATDVQRFRSAIGDSNGLILLLGVTPELTTLGRDLLAVDHSPRMAATIWPGDDARRRVIIADWTRLPFASSTFDAVIGDGSLNSAPETTDQLLQEIRRVLRPAGTAAFRLFCSPDRRETLRSIRADVEEVCRGNVHALKWRIAMSLAALTPGALVPVQHIRTAFERMFPDRGKLASRTGWSMDAIRTLDAYAGADHSLWFPTLSGALSAARPFFSQVKVLPGAGYPLAERCPTIAWRP